MQNKITLGYWAIRGRGQVLRHLLAHTGLDWEDKVYKDASEWFGIGDKTKLGFDFPNLPYLIEGDVKDQKSFKLTQSIAIAKYICKKSGHKQLLGKDQKDQARIEMVLSLLDEIFSPTYSLFFSPNHKAESARLFDGKIKGKISELCHFIGTKDTALGYLTLADFRIAEATNYFEKMYVENAKDFEALSNIKRHVQSLQGIKKYYKGQKAVKEPHLPSYAQLKF